MSLSTSIFTGAVLAAAAVPSTTLAVGIGERMLTPEAPRAVQRIAEGVPTLAPFGHVVFCQTYAAECRQSGVGPTILPLDDARRRLLQRINDEVNRSIRPVNDSPGPLGDLWSLEPRKGDCEDYAVTKRHRLMAAGIPASAMRLVTALTGSGEGHAALIVSTDQGDLVLDNRTKRILSWTQTRLVYLKVQSVSDPRRWFSVSGEAVASNDR